MQFSTSAQKGSFDKGRWSIQVKLQMSLSVSPNQKTGFQPGTKELISIEAARVTEQVHWCHKFVMFELTWKRQMSHPPASL